MTSEKARFRWVIFGDHCGQRRCFFLAGYENRQMDPDPAHIFPYILDILGYLDLFSDVSGVHPLDDLVLTDQGRFQEVINVFNCIQLKTNQRQSKSNCKDLIYRQICNTGVVTL